MAGQYIKGKEIADPLWQQFLDDIKAGEMEVPGGMTATEYEKMAVRTDAAMPDCCLQGTGTDPHTGRL